MDIKIVQDLVKIINKTNIAELMIEEADFKITIRQKEDKPEVIVAAPAPAPVVAASVPAPAQPMPGHAPAGKVDEKEFSDNAQIIRSPMIGTFYRSAAPGKPVFVNVGDEVTVGKVVCIVEAMKLFNEIESEISGKIVKVLVEDATPVEYDQPLFLVEPA